MGQTLTHGVYLPDEGERNCYSGLAANWQILDTAVGTVAEHTSQIAGKAPAVHTHTKSDITDFPVYGTTAGTICEGNDSRLSDARTPVAHTHGKADITDLLNSNFIPSANNSYDLGSSAYQWNNLYAKNYYYNGVAWGLDKSNTWTQSQTIKNTEYQIGEIPSAAKARYINFTDKNNVNIGWVQRRIEASGDSSIELFVYNRFTNSQPDPAGTTDYAILKVGLKSDQTHFCEITGDAYPRNNNAYNLGTSTTKWKTLNGINPGALSLPVLSGWVNIDTTNWNKTGADNSYTPTIDGWILLRLNNVTGNYIFVANSAYSLYSNATGSGSSWFDCFVPVRKDVALTIQIKGTNLVAARLYPMQGNV